MWWTPILLASILTLVHYFSEHGSKHINKYYNQVISLSAGIFITYILLEILPELSIAATVVGESIYIALLVGFVAFHISEKYVYQHVRNKKELLEELEHLHIAGFVIDHFIVGFTLVLLFHLPGEYSVLGWLVFVPFVLHTISSTLSLKHICRHLKATKLERLALSTSTIAGAAIATIMNLQKEPFYIAFGFMMGMLLYVVVRDILPQEREGKPYYFIIGVMLSMILIELAKLPL